ncbi:hypothetical protein RD792_009883 [Penstemon davidsonii]|uniref:FAD-binding domain-containing protein n=1 Tax=Penstemon davidsonii TaxID=160366 RepID=A0ABR0D0A9_9LAMI|nr:hypothetical protein RD792_009883 [Penstemon davidsonii]
MTCVHINDDKTKYLDRAYGRVNRKDLKLKLLSSCAANGVKFHKAKVWEVKHEEFESSISCDDGTELKASLIVDASGFTSSFVEYDKPRNHGYQVAHGILAETMAIAPLVAEAIAECLGSTRMIRGTALYSRAWNGDFSRLSLNLILIMAWFLSSRLSFGELVMLGLSFLEGVKFFEVGHGDKVSCTIGENGG